RESIPRASAARTLQKETSMISPSSLYATRWLVKDTFRQAKASGILWLMLGISGLAILLCLSVEIAGDVSLRERPKESKDFPARRDINEGARMAADLVAYHATLATGGIRVPPRPLMLPKEYLHVAAAIKDKMPFVQGELRLVFGAVRVPITRDREQAVRFVQL